MSSGYVKYFLGYIISLMSGLPGDRVPSSYTGPNTFVPAGQVSTHSLCLVVRRRGGQTSVPDPSGFFSLTNKWDLSDVIFSVSDPPQFLCGSGSRIPKMAGRQFI